MVEIGLLWLEVACIQLGGGGYFGLANFSPNFSVRQPENRFKLSVSRLRVTANRLNSLL
jgi:hypothetical protein